MSELMKIETKEFNGKQINLDCHKVKIAKQYQQERSLRSKIAWREVKLTKKYQELSSISFSSYLDEVKKNDHELTLLKKELNDLLSKLPPVVISKPAQTNCVRYEDVENLQEFNAFLNASRRKREKGEIEAWNRYAIKTIYLI